jgi:hypothetical protein
MVSLRVLKGLALLLSQALIVTASPVASSCRWAASVGTRLEESVAAAAGLPVLVTTKLPSTRTPLVLQAYRGGAMAAIKVAKTMTARQMETFKYVHFACDERAPQLPDSAQHVRRTRPSHTSVAHVRRTRPAISNRMFSSSTSACSLVESPVRLRVSLRILWRSSKHSCSRRILSAVILPLVEDTPSRSPNAFYRLMDPLDFGEDSLQP